MPNHNKHHSVPKLTARTLAHVEGVTDQLIHSSLKSVRRLLVLQPIEGQRHPEGTQRVMHIHKSGIRRISNDTLEKVVNTFSVKVASVQHSLARRFFF